MSNLLKKEMKLTASILSYLFILFAILTLCPGYPVLVGTFFACLGLFQTFQAAREANDITYTALLPVSKGDVVRAKYSFCIFIEMCYFALTAVFTLLRMTVLVDASLYRNNALMNTNLAYLGFVLLIFACFNLIFVGGFFKTSYKFAKPFVTFIIVAFLIVIVAEALHYFPGLAAVNAFGFEHMGVQLAFLAGGIVAYVLFTTLSMKKAITRFEKIDL